MGKYRICIISRRDLRLGDFGSRGFQGSEGGREAVGSEGLRGGVNPEPRANDLKQHLVCIM